MKWFARCFWLAAWALWLWLGVGLYRELPRDLEPPVCRLPLEFAETSVGFLPNTNEVAAIQAVRAHDETTISVYDVSTGERRRTVKGPPISTYFHPYANNRNPCDVQRHGLLLANSSAADDSEDATWGLHAMELASGRWRRIAVGAADWAVLHDTKPWVLFCERHAPGYSSRRIVVLDFQTKKELFAMHSPILGVRVAYGFFLPGTNRLVLAMTTNGNYPDGSAGRFAIWSLGEQPKLERTVETATIGDGNPATSATDRLAFGRPTPVDPSLDVVDLAEGKLVARFPGWQANDFSPGATAEPRCTISLDGKTVLGGKPASLWEIDSKRLLWQGVSHEACITDAARNEFAVFESWHLRLPGSLRFVWPQNLRTVAWRSLSTGEYLRRGWNEEFLPPTFMNSDGSLGVNLNGEVRPTALHVNWLVLALCQAILALPILLVLKLLRWRRRRTGASGKSSS